MNEAPKLERHASEDYLLPSHISLCALDGTLVVLDMRSGRYSSLPGYCIRALASIADEWSSFIPLNAQAQHQEHDDERILRALVGSGILTTTRRGGRPLPPPRIITTDSIDHGWGAEAPPKPNLGHMLSFIPSLLVSASRMRGASFERLVTSARRRSARLRKLHNQPDISKVKHLVLQFRRLPPAAYTVRGACLLDSLVLMEFLSHYNAAPTWIIGVDSRPFLAHSWLQYGDCVLNGSAEYVNQFTPIMVV